MTATNFRTLAQELAVALENLVLNLEEVEEDAHPETGEPYSDVEHARGVLARARRLLADKPHEGPDLGKTLEALLEWERTMGGFEAGVWSDLRALVRAWDPAIAATYECQDCGRTLDQDELAPVPVEGLLERVSPGEHRPAGECPDCGALCQPRQTRYDVHLYPVVRVKVPDIEADSHREAVKRARNRVDPNRLLSLTTHDGIHVFDIESAEDLAYYLVDEVGDADHARSVWYADPAHLKYLEGLKPLLPANPSPEDRYIEEGGVRCPYCGSPRLEGGEVTIDVGTAWQPFDCRDCNHA
jgi:DNA-directed RNA polymerase subunit RPC12/RpoP